MLECCFTAFHFTPNLYLLSLTSCVGCGWRRFGWKYAHPNPTHHAKNIQRYHCFFFLLKYQVRFTETWTLCSTGDKDKKHMRQKHFIADCHFSAIIRDPTTLLIASADLIHTLAICLEYERFMSTTLHWGKEKISWLMIDLCHLFVG